MADTKISALTAATSVAAADQMVIVQGGASKMATAAMIQQYTGAGYRNGSTATVSAAYAVDTYLAGSSVTVPAGAWKVGTIYQCTFDMTKTGAGTATPIIIVRLGTLGTTGDTNVASATFAVGTAVADTGVFVLTTVFRVVGGSATMSLMASCGHHLAATGLTTTGASGTGIILQTAGPFSSSTATIIGLSFNGGASFSGTNTIVQASVLL